MKGDTLILSQIHVIITEKVNDMAKLRTASYRYVTIDQAPAGEVELTNLIRDVNPDKPFKIRGWTGYIESQDGTEGSIHIMKNAGKPPGPTKGDAVLPVHTHIFSAMTRQAAIVEHFSVQLTEPMDFDDDDSLNVKYAWSTLGAGFCKGFTLIFYYTIG